MPQAKSRSRAHPAPMAAVAAGLLAALVSLAACADIIRLTNGREIRGVVVSEADGRVVVKVPGGTLSIPADMVAYIERESEVTYRLWQAKDLSARGSDKMAIEELRAALRLEPGSGEAKGALASALRERARSLEAAGSLSEARRTWEEVASLKGGDAAATAAVERIRSSVESLRRDIVAAKRLLSEKDSAGASAAFERVLAAAPEMRPELSAHYACSLIGVGDDLYRRRDYAGAAGRYSLALEFDPTLAQEIEPRYVNARLHVVAGKISSGLFDEAEKELKALAGFSPTNVEVKYIAGRYAEIRGRWREAAGAYARALNVALAGEPDEAKAAELRA